MDQRVTALLEQLIPTPDQLDSLSPERQQAIDLATWVANTLWQLKEGGGRSEPIDQRVGLIPDDIVRQSLPLFEAKGWKAAFHEDFGLGDGSHVTLTRA